MTVKWTPCVLCSLILGASSLAFSASLPQILAGNRIQGAYRNQAAFKVHLVPKSDYDTEIVLPTDEFLDVAEEEHLVWVEGDDQISVARVLMPFTLENVPLDQPIKKVMLGMTPAGGVFLKRSADWPEAQQLRLLSLESHLYQDQIHSVFWRRKERVDGSVDALLMPQGPALALLCDSKANQCVAISAPIDVEAGHTSNIDLHHPAKNRSDLLVRINRPEVARTMIGNTVTCSLSEDSSEKRAPDVLTPSPWEIFAIWYDVPAGVSTLEIDGEALWASPQEIKLRGGTLTEVSVETSRKPSLAVELSIPRELQGLGRNVLAVSEVDMAPIQRRELELPLPQEISLVRLPPKEMAVSLALGPWQFTERIDLSDAKDGRILIQPEIVRIGGEVTRAGEPMEALLTFSVSVPGNNQISPVEISTDEAGLFETLIFPDQTIPAIGVSSLVERGAPYWYNIDQPFTDGAYFNIEVPGNSVEIVVSNRSTGQTIESARVMYRLSRLADVEGEKSTRGGSGVTDSEGAVRITALDGGSLEMRAEASGYVSSNTIHTEISLDDGHRKFSIDLDPDEEAVSLLMELPDGNHAAGAHAALFDYSMERLIWGGQADSQGVLEVPSSIGTGVLFLLHEKSSFRAIKWENGNFPKKIKLPPSGGRLTIRTVQPNGETAPRSMITVRLEDKTIPIGLLSWLGSVGGVPPSSDQGGIWWADFLPPGPVEVMAWVLNGDLRNAVISGDLDYRTETIYLPSTGVHEIQTLLP